MDLGLKDKVAVVIGTRSIGRAVALGLGREGAKVVAHYNSSSRQAEEVVETLRGEGRSAIAVQADVTSEAQVEALFEKAIAEFGQVDILVHSVGVWPTHPVEEMELSDFEDCMRINTTSVFLTNRYMVRHLRGRGAKGSILNFTSQAAFKGATTYHAHYAASKAAIVAFSISLAREMATHGILVNCIAPGLAYSEMGGMPEKGSNPEKEAYYTTRIPLGRIAEPEEVANIAVFAVSPLNSYMTGATLDASGGILMR